MRLLVLDEEFPYPTNNGKRTRSLNLYCRLAATFEIAYIGYGQDGAAANALKTFGIQPIPVDATIPPKQGSGFYLRLLANLASPLPYIVTSHFSRTYRQAVLRALAAFQPDLVIFEWTPYVHYAKDLPPVRKLASTHNIEADIWQRYFENERRLLRRWYIGEQWRKIRRFERAALSCVDAAIAVSDLDRTHLAQIAPELPIAVIPNGVDLEYFRPLPQPELARHIVFTGSMDWRPNQDAAHYFVREILPLLKKARPDLECTFVGRSPPNDVLDLQRTPGVHVTGTVADVRPFVENASVYIVPLRIGGGSRLKILEALAMGRAVVSTAVGAEGLDVIHDLHVMLADEPESFAAGILRLLDDPERCRVLAREGRRLVEERYGWDSLAREFGAFIEEVAGQT